MANEQILVVEDEQVLRVNLVRYLTAQGFQVDSVAEGAAAAALLENRLFDVILTDLRLPGDIQGMELVRHVRAIAPTTVVVIMTSFGTLDSALEAFRSGAHDYLLKPFSLEDLGQKVANIGQFRKLTHENMLLRQELQSRKGPASMLIGKSRAVVEVGRLIMKVAACSSTVLITGESGTGKELVARSLHKHGRREGLFVPVNVAAIPANLMESHLFGHVRGAFTGAERSREGAFRTASGGTLFLDEIGELPRSEQPKLLRSLEDKEIWPVGSDTSVRVQARVVAATHRDLRQMVQDGSFREDLLFRLNVVNIHIPPLRERVEDIPLLVNHFISRYRQELAKPVRTVDSETMRCLMSYPWKGNVRELSNVIERAMLLSESDILHIGDLPAEIRSGAEAFPQNLNEAVERFQLRHIVSVLESVGGNREFAAKVLGLSTATLYRLLEKLGLKGYRCQASPLGDRMRGVS
jgi:DNA-binding NtrC family response regulator